MGVLIVVSDMYVMVAVANQAKDILVVVEKDGGVTNAHMICVLNVTHVLLFHHLRLILPPPRLHQKKQKHLRHRHHHHQ